MKNTLLSPVSLAALGILVVPLMAMPLYQGASASSKSILAATVIASIEDDASEDFPNPIPYTANVTVTSLGPDGAITVVVLDSNGKAVAGWPLKGNPATTPEFGLLPGHTIRIVDTTNTGANPDGDTDKVNVAFVIN